MADFDLTGRTALVTGGNIGIGQAAALALAAHGADVALTFHRHDGEGTVQAIQALGRRAVAARLDVTDPAAIAQIIPQLIAQLGKRLDILFNNAGGLVERRGLSEITPDHFASVFAVNVASTILVSQAALPVMSIGGRIINMGSLAAHTGGGGGALAYAAAKGALHTLTRGMAKELAPRGILVNAVAPGFIGDTPFHDTFSTAEAQAAMVQQTLVKRGGRPEDVAAAVVFLAASTASFMDGEILEINGGSWFS